MTDKTTLDMRGLDLLDERDVEMGRDAALLWEAEQNRLSTQDVYSVIMRQVREIKPLTNRKPA